MDRTRREVIEEHLGTVARARSDDDAAMIGVHFLAPPDCETAECPLSQRLAHSLGKACFSSFIPASVT
jgi:hypothetical protein